MFLVNVRLLVTSYHTFFERCLMHEKCVRTASKNRNTFIRSNRFGAFISPRDMPTDLRDNGSKL